MLLGLTEQRGQIRKGITSLHVAGRAWMKMLIAFQKNSQNREATQAGRRSGGGAAALLTANESRTLRFSDRYTVFFFLSFFFKDSPFVRALASFSTFARIL